MLVTMYSREHYAGGTGWPRSLASVLGITCRVIGMSPTTDGASYYSIKREGHARSSAPVRAGKSVLMTTSGRCQSARSARDFAVGLDHRTTLAALARGALSLKVGAKIIEGCYRIF
jgi:hypothetical protein